MNFTFFRCSSLISLPDISKWNIFNSNYDYLYSYLSILDMNMDVDLMYKNNTFLNEKKKDLFLGEFTLQLNELN